MFGSGGGNLPNNFKNYLMSWQEKNPDYEIKEWNEENFDFSDSPYAQEAYKAKKYGFVSDYIRAKVLYKYGGIYLDTDVEILKNFDIFLNDDLFISFENEAYLESAVIGAIPKHPLFREVISFYENAHFINKKGKLNIIPNTVLLTVFMKKLCNLKQKNKEQILEFEGKNLHIYELHTFAPINYITKKLEVKENTYAIHHFDGSWLNKKVSAQNKFIRFIYKITPKSLFGAYIRVYLRFVSNSFKSKYFYDQKKSKKSYKTIKKEAI